MTNKIISAVVFGMNTIHYVNSEIVDKINHSLRNLAAQAAHKRVRFPLKVINVMDQWIYM